MAKLLLSSAILSNVEVFGMRTVQMAGGVRSVKLAGHLTQEDEEPYPCSKLCFVSGSLCKKTYAAAVKNEGGACGTACVPNAEGMCDAVVQAPAVEPEPELRIEEPDFREVESPPEETVAEEAYPCEKVCWLTGGACRKTFSAAVQGKGDDCPTRCVPGADGASCVSGAVADAEEALPEQEAWGTLHERPDPVVIEMSGGHPHNVEPLVKVEDDTDEESVVVPDMMEESSEDAVIDDDIPAPLEEAPAVDEKDEKDDYHEDMDEPEPEAEVVEDEDEEDQADLTEHVHLGEFHGDPSLMHEAVELIRGSMEECKSKDTKSSRDDCCLFSCFKMRDFNQHVRAACIKNCVYAEPFPTKK